MAGEALERFSGAGAAPVLKDFTPEAMSDFQETMKGRYKYLIANFEKARQSEEVKTMGQKQKARIDEARARLDEAYKALDTRLKELIKSYVPSASPNAPQRATV